MKSTGLVFSMRQYLGSAEPPPTVLEDESRFGSDGAFRADGQPNWVKTPKGLWVLDFNSATPDYIEIPADQTQLDFTSEDFSIVVRLKADILTSNRRIFYRGLLNTEGYYVYLDTTRWGFVTNQGAAFQLSKTALDTLAIDTYYTLGVSRSGASAVLYINGVDASDESGTHINPVSSNRTVKIGIHDDLTNGPFDGEIALLDIYNYALAPEQHAAIHYKLKQWG